MRRLGSKSMNRRKKPIWSMARIFARAKRDGTPTVAVSVYPTEREAMKWRAAQKRFNFFTLPELITEAIRWMELKCVPYNIILDGEMAHHAEILASELGYLNAEEWLNESVKESVDQAWRDRCRLFAETGEVR